CRGTSGRSRWASWCWPWRCPSTSSSGEVTEAMTLDIRIPIGLLFAIVGGLLVAYGLLSDRALYRRSLGININLWCWPAALAFGALLIFLGRRRSKPPSRANGLTTAPPEAAGPSRGGH